MRSLRHARTKHRTTGVTLVELLLAMTIAGILAAVGYAAYSSQIERLRLQDAVAEIGRIQLAIAQFTSRPDRPRGGLPDSLEALGLDPALLTDPWGRPYRYARRAGLNRDYDLYSLGRNGVTGPVLDGDLAADDIVRGANGAFVGTSAEFAAISGTEVAQFTASVTGGVSAGTATADGGSLLVR